MRNLKRARLLFGLIAPLFFGIEGGVAQARIFLHKDSAGQIHYSDKASPSAIELKVDPGYSYAIVKQVYDGDTLVLAGGKKVRMLGINTPEVENSRKRGEPGGERAKRWLAAQLQGKKVRLETDVVRRDKYRRHLAHVFSEEGRHLNRELLEQGLATVNIHPPNLKYADMLIAAQQSAESRKLGVWGDSAYTPKPIEGLTGKGARGWQRLVGIPIRIRGGRKYTRLIFRNQVDVRIPHDNLFVFRDLERYLGLKIEVRGWLSRRKNKYSILVRHPSQLVETRTAAEVTP